MCFFVITLSSAVYTKYLHIKKVYKCVFKSSKLMFKGMFMFYSKSQVFSRSCIQMAQGHSNIW